MFDNNSGFDAKETFASVGRDSAAIKDPYSLDFNSDGRSDLLWHNPGSGQSELWLMSGSAQDYGAQIGDRVSIPSIGQGWQVEGIADFNRDGHTDLLVRNERTGDNAALYMGGDKGSEVQGRDGITGIGSDWEIKGVSDFDNDEQADILWRNRSTGEHVVWYMGGSGGASVDAREQISSPGRQWSAEGLADFDGDGRSDVLWRNEDSGENLVWYLKGDKGTERKDSERVETFRDGGWTLRGAGDLDQDGAIELLWHHSSSGDSTLWQMRGEKGTQVEARSRFSGKQGDWMPVVTGWAPESVASDRTSNPVDDSASDGGASGNSSEAPSTNGSNNSSSDGFNIEFDYRFDTNNWFDSGKRAVLEKAAEIWEAIILDDFEDIKAGTTVHATNPDGSGLTSFKLKSDIDDIRVFAFAQDLNGDHSLAEAGATTYPGDRNTNSVFQPWLGEIVFNHKESWYVNDDTSKAPNIPQYQADMLSVAVHEIGHILGISSGISAFRSLIKNGKFTGEAATALNDGEAIPLDNRGSHIEDDFEVKGLGENSLDPNIEKGTRKLLTRLDVALLEDIGYSVDYSTLDAVPKINFLAVQEGDRNLTSLRANNSYTIRWEDNLSEEVKIELYEGNRYVRTIVNSTKSTGEFNWRVTSDLADGRYYRIKISSVEDKEIFNISDSYFKVEENRYINIDTPSDNYPLRTGSEFELTWSDNIKETVKIELYKDGAYHRTITGSTQSDGRYQWKIPTYLESSRSYHLRFTSTSDSSVYDESAKFWIQRS